MIDIFETLGEAPPDVAVGDDRHADTNRTLANSHRLLSANPVPVGVLVLPVGIGEVKLADLVAGYEAGRLKPIPVQLGELPAAAGKDERRVAEDMALLIGLRLAVDDRRPLPYSTTFAAGRMGWTAKGRPDASRASKALRSLVAAGVIVHAYTLKPRPGKPDGTKTYAPPCPRHE